MQIRLRRSRVCTSVTFGGGKQFVQEAMFHPVLFRHCDGNGQGRGASTFAARVGYG